MRKQHTFPTVVGLIILIAGVAVGVFLVQTRQTFKLSADPGEEPKDVRITNVTDNSFAVSWTTGKPTFGYVTYEKSEELARGGDETLRSYLHHITVRGLSASTNYQFKIGSGEYLFDREGESYKVRSGPVLSPPKKSTIVFGTISEDQGGAADGAIVYLTLPGTSPLSTVADSNGSWVFDLTSARQSDLKGSASYSEKTIMEIYVVGTGKIATARIPVGAARPVPEMVLGDNYNWVNSQTLEGGILPSSSLDLTPVSE